LFNECFANDINSRFKVQHNLTIYSDSRGIRMPNPDWARGGSGDGAG